MQTPPLRTAGGLGNLCGPEAAGLPTCCCQPRECQGGDWGGGVGRLLLLAQRSPCAL